MWTSSSSSSSVHSRSLSSSTSSSSPPYAAISAVATTNPRRPRTMEEVWKDITLASDLRRQPTSPGVILQDFFSKDPPPSSVPPPPPPPPLPPTMLTLNSAPDHHFSSLLLQPHHQIHHIPHVNAAFPDDNAGGGKKKFPDFDRSSGDRRHKRMIKNRESAARSRARKQAYTNELEQEVANLLEENSRLKKQQQELYRVAAAAEHLRKKPLHRTSTAPF